MWRIVTILVVCLVCAVACRRGDVERRMLPFVALWLATLMLQTIVGRIPLTERSAIIAPLHALGLVWSQPWVSHSQWTFYGLVGNVLLFVPLGMLLSTSERQSLRLIVPLLVSLAVECVQWLTCLGTFEVDDVICNVVGCILGHALGRWLGGLGCGGFLLPGLYLLSLGVCSMHSILFV